MQNISQNESLEIDFEGVTTFTPSWADEFITKLVDKFGKQVHFVNDDNPSVRATIELLKKIELAR